MKNLIENLPFWIFLILIFSLPFVNLPAFYYQNFPIQLTDFLFPMNVAVWLLFLLLGKNKIRVSWFYLPLSLYFVSLCLSTYFSEYQAGSFTKLLGSTYLIGLAVLGFNLIDSEDKLVKITWIWLAATFLVCLVSLISLILFYLERDNPILVYTLSHYGSLPMGNYPRIRSTFTNMNMLCNYLNVSTVCLLVAFKGHWSSKTSLIVFSILLAIATFFTVSPGIGGILLVTGMWFWLDLKTIKPIFSKICLFIGIFSAGCFFLVTLISPTNFPKQISPSARLLTWQSALEITRENPIVGRGLGLFTALVDYDGPAGIQKLGDAHQLWLSVAAQQGVVGFMAIVFLMVWLLRKSIPLRLDKDVSNFRTAFGLAFIGSFCYQGLSGSFEDARHLWVLIGILASAIEGQNKKGTG